MEKKQFPSKVLINATPQFQIEFDGESIKSCIYHAGATIYTGTCYFCNQTKKPPMTVPQLGFMGRCEVAFVFIVRKKDDKYLTDFHFNLESVVMK